MRLPPAALGVLLLLPGPAPAVTSVELVLDASVSMGEPLEGSLTRLAAARAALAEVVAALPADDRTVAVGLRVNGGAVPWSLPGACDDTELVTPVAPGSRDALLAALLEVQPGGADLAAISIARAASDLGGTEGRRVVVLVTDGDAGGCDGDWLGAAEALAAAEVELWVVGAGLGERAAAVEARAQLVAAGTAAELVAGVRQAVGSAVELATEPQPLRLRVHRGDAPVELASATLDRPEEVSRELEATDGVLRGEAAPGVYRVALTEPDGIAWTVAGLRLLAGAEVDLDLELPGADGPRLEVTPAALPARHEVTVRYAGARPRTSWLTVAPFAAPVGERTPQWVRLDEADGEVRLAAPEQPGAAQARMHVEVGSGGSLLAAKTLLTVQSPVEPLRLPAEVEAGEAVEVAWDGPLAPGDCVTLAPPGVAGPAPGACRPVVDAGPVILEVPPGPGTARVRLLSGRTARTLAEAPLEVVPPRPRLSPPAQAKAGEVLEVPWSWRGEPGPYDYLAVAAVGSAEGEYLSFAPAVPDEVARLRAPRAVGTYEVRYVSGQGDATLAAAPLEVVLPAATVSGPREAMANTRVEVEWTGPDHTGDLVAVAPAGAGPSRILDWTYTSAGSPLTVAVPARPGEYELRYLSGGEVLASAALAVRPPG